MRDSGPHLVLMLGEGPFLVSTGRGLVVCFPVAPSWSVCLPLVNGFRQPAEDWASVGAYDHVGLGKIVAAKRAGFHANAASEL